MTGSSDDWDRELMAKITVVANWLTDPVVNRRISAHGFSFGFNRIQEVADSIAALNRHLWSRKLKGSQQDRGLSELFTIRLYVSFNLEPEVPQALKYAFCEAYRRDLPELFDSGNHLLEVIEANDFKNPNGFQKTAVLCLKALNVDINRVRFDERFQRFSFEEQQAWAQENALPPEDDWGS
jgi:hypothetical protein